MRVVQVADREVDRHGQLAPGGVPGRALGDRPVEHALGHARRSGRSARRSAGTRPAAAGRAPGAASAPAPRRRARWPSARSTIGWKWTTISSSRLQRPAEVADHAEAADRVVSCRAVEAVPVAVLLGAVHRDVGSTQQRLRVGAVGWDSARSPMLASTSSVMSSNSTGSRTQASTSSTSAVSAASSRS